MKPITWDRSCYRIDNQPIYLNSGEFHYFRVPASDWHRRMVLFKEAGGNAIATYIPWLLHEPEEGTFDFGTPPPSGALPTYGGNGFGLERFLQTAQDVGLYVIARPGPYQYSELIYGGLPGWLFERYPEVQAHTLEGHPFGLPSVSYLHPTFMEKAAAWIAAVGRLLSRYTVSRGGPIALTQFDNELTGIHLWFGGLDYNAAAMGFGDPEGRYPRYLQAKYQDMDQLNAAYGTDYAAFAAVRPITPDQARPGRAADVRRLRDYFNFYLSAVTTYAEKLCTLYREAGIDTPFIHNAANPGMNAYFLEMIEALGDDFLLGSDHYYNLGQSWPQNNPTPQYARNVFLSNEQLRLMGFPPTILELPSGSASDWPPITARDAEAAYMTNLAYGMKGHNYYVFTGGPNPSGAGETTDLYDYGAPIGPSGQIRPLYDAQVVFGEFIKTYPWLVEAEAVFDCRIGLSFENARAERYWVGRGASPEQDGLLFTGPEAWRFMSEGLLTTAFCTRLSPAGINLDDDAWVDDVATPLLIAAADTMARAQRERIVRFLSNGGRALIAPVLPRFDEELQPCTVLADFLGAPAFRYGTDAVIRVRISGDADTDNHDIVNVLKNEVFFTEKVPEGAQVVGYDELTDRPIAWELETAGDGRALVLGLVWDYRKHEQSETLLTLLHRLGLRRAVRCTNPNVWTSVRMEGNKGLLFLMNLFSTPMKANVSYTIGNGAHIDLGEHHLDAMSVKAVEVFG